MNRKNQNPMHAVVASYSFASPNVFLFPTHTEAICFIRETFERETKLERECGHRFSSSIEEDCSKATIVNYRASGDVDTSVWEIVEEIDFPD